MNTSSLHVVARCGLSGDTLAQLAHHDFMCVDRIEDLLDRVGGWEHLTDTHVVDAEIMLPRGSALTDRADVVAYLASLDAWRYGLRLLEPGQDKAERRAVWTANIDAEEHPRRDSPARIRAALPDLMAVLTDKERTDAKLSYNGLLWGFEPKHFLPPTPDDVPIFRGVRITTLKLLKWALAEEQIERDALNASHATNNEPTSTNPPADTSGEPATAAPLGEVRSDA
jgi:hypothetical protein